MSTCKHKYSLPSGGNCVVFGNSTGKIGKLVISGVKSILLKKVVDSILSINTFEQQCVVIKCMLQSSRLEDHMDTICIYQSSFTRSSFEHRCMNNIKKIYQHAGKCDDQQNLKYIIDAAILIVYWIVMKNKSSALTRLD